MSGRPTLQNNNLFKQLTEMQKREIPVNEVRLVAGMCKHQISNILEMQEKANIAQRLRKKSKKLWIETSFKGHSLSKFLVLPDEPESITVDTYASHSDSEVEQSILPF